MLVVLPFQQYQYLRSILGKYHIPKRQSIVQLTNISCLDHAHIISTIAYTKNTFLGMVSDDTSDFSL